MKIAKILICGLLSVLLLSGCAGTAKPDGSVESLTKILDTFAASTGNLERMQCGVELVTWMKNTELSNKEIASAVGAWMQSASPEIRERLQAMLTRVAEEGASFLSENAEKVQQGLEDGSIQQKFKAILEEILASGGVEK